MRKAIHWNNRKNKKGTYLFFVSTDATLDMRRIIRLPVISITRPRCIVTAVTRVEYSTARKLHKATPLIMLALPSRALLDRRPFSPKPPYIPVFIFYVFSPVSLVSFPYLSLSSFSHFSIFPFSFFSFSPFSFFSFSHFSCLSFSLFSQLSFLSRCLTLRFCSFFASFHNPFNFCACLRHLAFKCGK